MNKPSGGSGLQFQVPRPSDSRAVPDISRRSLPYGCSKPFEQSLNSQLRQSLEERGLPSILTLSAAALLRVDSYRCKDVMRFSGEEREVALGLLHGYVLGKDKKTVFNPDALAKITDNFMDYCLDHPDEKALTVFERTAKSE
ncbi:MAG: HdeA/HdeB family chaperone [Sedimenticolaceae bacterium]